MFPITRSRRLRSSKNIRSMVKETTLSVNDFIYPLFVCEGKSIRHEVPSMPGIYNLSVDEVIKEAKEAENLGIKSVILFGIPDHKDEEGSGAYGSEGIVQKAIKAIKDYTDLYVITDVCMCEYTSHGHCGHIINGDVDNDSTLNMLAREALSHAEAGADMVAPSDMMDGRVAAIRQILDENGFQNIPIMAYSAKFASYFYGPFREAAGSAPSFGDRRSYQMDPHNGREAMRECALDVQEGADILMVKPALAYLDLVREARQRFDLPIACYAVSGEYAMIKSAAKAGLVDEYGIMCESAVCMYRAGADILITYYACELAEAIRKGDIG